MPNTRRALKQALADWRRAGVTSLPRKAPLPQLEVEQTPAAPASSPPPQIEMKRSPAPQPAPPPTSTETASQAQRPVLTSSAGRPEQLAELAERVARCVRCRELAETRTQTVFGVGNPRARVMFIGEAPGADEDAQGEPFVGKAGQLLNKIIAACGWKREDLYICNILRCRPPGNRNPTPQEAANCREYLDAQIRIVDPEYIVCWGTVAAQNLLGDPSPIGRLRSKWFKYGRAKVLCTYHPSYLLRNPAAKKPVWDDMKFLLADMGLEPPTP